MAPDPHPATDDAEAPSPARGHRFEVPAGDDVLAWDIRGETLVGADDVLLDHDDDLTSETAWTSDGYTVAPLLEQDEWVELRDVVTGLVVADLCSLGHRVPTEFSLERYHDLVTTDEQHLALMRIRNSYFAIDRLPVDVGRIEGRVSGLLSSEVRTLRPSDVPASFGVRIVRPGSRDNNPPHRDAWLDRLRSTITLYVPLAGSTARSSLTLVPGSHRWRESEIERTAPDTTVDGVRYSVPAVAGATRPLRLIRPDPGPGDAIVFSPYLIHGGARNMESDVTRVSVELRFARA